MPRDASACQPSEAVDAGCLLPDGYEGAQRLGYAEAAAEFVTWLQRNGETGEINRNRLVRLYGRHCQELGFSILPDNHFFGALGKLARRWERRVPRRDGHRQRVTTYDIPRQSRAIEATPIKQWRAA